MVRDRKCRQRSKGVINMLMDVDRLHRMHQLKTRKWSLFPDCHKTLMSNSSVMFLLLSMEILK